MVAVGIGTGLELVGPHHDDDPVLEALRGINRLDLEGLLGYLVPRPPVLVQPRHRGNLTEFFDKSFEQVLFLPRDPVIEDADLVRMDVHVFVLELHLAFKEPLHNVDDPRTFVCMVLAGIQDGTRSPAGCLGRVDRYDRDRVLGIFNVLRGEMLGQFQDLFGIPVIPIKVECLVDRPSCCPDPERLPADRADEPDALVPVAHNQEITFEGIPQPLKNAGEPDRGEVLGLVNQDGIIMPEIPGPALKVFEQPLPEAFIALDLFRLRIPVPDDPVVFCPAVEMEDMDPGIVLQQHSEIGTQGYIKTEQEDLCIRVAVIEPLAPGDQEDCFPGTGNAVNDPVPLADSPGIVLLPAVEDDQIEALVGLFFRQDPCGNITQDDLRMDDRSENIDLFGREPVDLPERVEEPHERGA